MENHTKILFIVVSLSLFSICVQAQNAIPAAGGDAQGSGGSSSYTIGQVVYTTIQSETGSSAQGVQHPYIVDIVSGIDESTIQLEIVAYPNPATHWVNIQIKDLKNRKLNYHLFDVTGKLMAQASINQSITSIEMRDLAASTYLLSISEKHKTIKTFKINKTK